jgi:hypothetical protein
MECKHGAVSQCKQGNVSTELCHSTNGDNTSTELCHSTGGESLVRSCVTVQVSSSESTELCHSTDTISINTELCHSVDTKEKREERKTRQMRPLGVEIYLFSISETAGYLYK